MDKFQEFLNSLKGLISEYEGAGSAPEAGQTEGEEEPVAEAEVEAPAEETPEEQATERPKTSNVLAKFMSKPKRAM